MRLLSVLALGLSVLFGGQVLNATSAIGVSDEPIRMSASEFPSEERLFAMEAPTQTFIKLLEKREDKDGDQGPTDPVDDGTTDPVTEDPVTEDPVTEDPVTEDPVTEDPVTEDPVTEDPVTEDPVTEDPVTDPVTDPNALPAVPVGGNDLQIGMNIAWFNYYTPQWWNVDVARWVELSSGNYHRSWVTSGNRELDLRSDGYPNGLVSLTGDVESVSGGSSEMTISSSNHGLRVGDMVRFYGITSGGGDHTGRVVSTSSNSFRVQPGVSSPQSGGSWDYQQQAGGLTLRSIDGRYPTGEYTLKFEGKGAIELNYGASGRYENDGNGEAKFSVPVQSTNSGIELNIVESDPSNPVHNVRLFMPGFDDGDDFHPLFIERLKPFRATLRFMDTNQTNNSNVVSWSDRTPEDWPWYGQGGYVRYKRGTATRLETASNSGSFWGGWGDVARVTSQNHGLKTGHRIEMDISGLIRSSSPVRVIDANTFEMRTQEPVGTITGNWTWELEIRSGYPYEKMVDLCNRTRSHMWICVPLLADDDYMRNLAQLIREDLDPDLKVYVELSNEVWNAIFSQYNIVAGWANEKGMKFGEAYANRARDLFQIFHEEFGGETDRVIRVIGSQRVSAWRSNEILQHMNGEFDALAITTYFSGVGTNMSSSTTGEDIAQLALEEVSSDDWIEPMLAQADLVEKYSNELGREIRLLAYEGGQHVSANGRHTSYEESYYDAQRHPLMGEAYQVMLDRFESIGGDLLVAFNYVAIDTIYGSWGHLRYQDSDPLEHPKYRVLVDHIDSVLQEGY